MFKTDAINDNYQTFADHPMSAMYFKLIDILIKKDLSRMAQDLMELAHAPFTGEVKDKITQIMCDLHRLIDENSEYTNEFIELDEEANHTFH